MKKNLSYKDFKNRERENNKDDSGERIRGKNTIKSVNDYSKEKARSYRMNRNYA